jgi:antitoxin MazE
MRVTLKKWGNSASVRIPAALMVAAKLQLDDVVDVREEDGLIIIEPVRQKRYDLAKLLAGVTPRNLHTGTDFGRPSAKRSSDGVICAQEGQSDQHIRRRPSVHQLCLGPCLQHT